MLGARSRRSAPLTPDCVPRESVARSRGAPGLWRPVKLSRIRPTVEEDGSSSEEARFLADNSETRRRSGIAPETKIVPLVEPYKIRCVSTLRTLGVTLMTASS